MFLCSWFVIGVVLLHVCFLFCGWCCVVFMCVCCFRMVSYVCVFSRVLPCYVDLVCIGLFVLFRCGLFSSLLFSAPLLSLFSILSSPLLFLGLVRFDSVPSDLFCYALINYGLFCSVPCCCSPIWEARLRPSTYKRLGSLLLGFEVVVSP